MAIKAIFSGSSIHDAVLFALGKIEGRWGLRGSQSRLTTLLICLVDVLLVDSFAAEYAPSLNLRVELFLHHLVLAPHQTVLELDVVESPCMLCALASLPTCWRESVHGCLKVVL